MEELAASLSIVITSKGLLLILAGCLVALLLGMLPGLSSTEAMIMLLPFSYSLNLHESMLLLSSAYASAFVGGALTSIVFGIPGSSTGLATVFDGHALHRSGKTIYAVTVASVSSAVAGLLALGVVVLLMPIMEPLSLLFGPPEWFAFVLFGLVVLAFSDESNFTRGLISAGLGLLAGTVGMAVMTAEPRYTLGISDLWGGIPIIAAFVGLYPLAEAFGMMKKKTKPSEQKSLKATHLEKGQVLEGCKDCARHGDKIIIGGATGWIIGIIPGVGATLANILAYLLVKSTSKNNENFGKGDVRGLIAAESANNGSVGGALVPALALGIPGSLNTAILLGVFLINGIQPGANVFAENLDVTWSILIAVAAGTILASVIVMAGGWRVVSLVSKLRPETIAPIIIVISCIAVLLARNNPFDLGLAVVFAILGILMQRFSFSRISFVIALMLGPLIESSYFQSLSIGRGSYEVFVSSPMSLILWTVIALAVGLHFVRLIRSGKAKKTNRITEALDGE